jgi:hypothetical protein
MTELDRLLLDNLFPYRREVSSPLTREMLSPLDPRCTTVQFKSALSGRDYDRLSTFLSKYPDIELRAYASYDGSIKNLDFLAQFPTIRRFSVDSIWDSLVSIDGLRYLRADLRQLSIGQTKKTFSLSLLSRFAELKELWLEKHTRDIEVVMTLTKLEDLGLRSITLKSLGVLKPLQKLKSLAIGFGGTADLSGIQELLALRTFEMWWNKAIVDLEPLAESTTVRTVQLQSLRNVSVIPDLSKMVALENFYIEAMKGIADVRPLLSAPNLKVATFINMPHLQPSDIAVLAKHHSLSRVVAGLGSKRKNDEVLRLVPQARKAINPSED